MHPTATGWEPGPPVCDYRGRGAPSHRLGLIHPYVRSCSWCCGGSGPRPDRTRCPLPAVRQGPALRPMPLQPRAWTRLQAYKSMATTSHTSLNFCVSCVRLCAGSNHFLWNAVLGHPKTKSNTEVWNERFVHNFSSVNEIFVSISKLGVSPANLLNQPRC